eukprot:s777_g51.t1
MKLDESGKATQILCCDGLQFGLNKACEAWLRYAAAFLAHVNGGFNGEFRQQIPLDGLDAKLLRSPRDAGLTYFGKAAGADLGAVTPGHAGQYYQRVPFASTEGRKLFKKALQAGTMESFFFLAEQFRTQDEPTFCGLTTLAMVLNSLRIDPMRTWKGAWRWYNEQNLACCFGPDASAERHGIPGEFSQ